MRKYFTDNWEILYQTKIASIQEIITLSLWKIKAFILKYHYYTMKTEDKFKSHYFKSKSPNTTV